MTQHISRQAFVRGALGAVAAGALLGSCRSKPAPAPPTPPGTPAPQPTSAAAGPPDFSALAATIEGRVVLPSSAEFAAAKGVFNTRFAGSTPVAVVAVKSTADLQKAVAFAAKNQVKVAARSGGHSYIAASAPNGAMVIDLRQLPGTVTFDEGRGLATVSAAADLNSVQTALAAHGRSIPTGTCPTVGVAGLTLGGGLGTTARNWGLTCDALTSAAVVLPSGEAVTASPDDHPDLFWALRGGGGGNFGVVTSFTFRTFATGDRDVVNLAFPESATAETILGWHTWLSTADRAIWGMVDITVGSGVGRCGIVLATPSGVGRKAAETLSTAIGIRPIENTVQTLGHLDFVHYFAGGEQATRPRSFVAGSDIIGEMTPAAAKSVVAGAASWPPEAGAATAVIESLDAAVGDVGPGDSAFPWRRQAANVQWYTEPQSPGGVDTATKWLASAHEAVRAGSVGGYVNYLEADTPAARYFGANLLRLSQIRQKYDPAGLMYSGAPY
jgi:FAD/FMN-containing dehydrogenase